VDVRLDAMVTGVDERGITVRRKAADGATTDERIEAVTKVWAAGVAASPLAKQLADQVGAPGRPGRDASRFNRTSPSSATRRSMSSAT
jgi:NADH dehydrogenase